MARTIKTMEVAKLCGVSSSTVQYWEKMGYLESFKTLGGHRRFKIETVMEFMKTRNLPVPGNLIEKSSAERRLEKRVPVSYDMQAHLFEERFNRTMEVKGKVLDLSTRGFCIEIKDTDIHETTLRVILKRCNRVKAFVHDSVGFIRNPLAGKVRNCFFREGSIRIGAEFCV